MLTSSNPERIEARVGVSIMKYLALVIGLGDKGPK